MPRALRLGLAGAALVLLSLSGWWYIQVSTLRDEVARSLDLYVAQAKTAAPNLVISHGAIRLAGFPLRRSLVLESVTLELTEPGQVVYAVMPGDLRLNLEDSHSLTFTLTREGPFSARYKDAQLAEDYTISVSPWPLVQLRRSPASASAPIQQVQALLPTHTRLTITMGGQTREVDFNYPLPLPYAWRDVPLDVRYGVRLFVLMLREAVIYN